MNTDKHLHGFHNIHAGWRKSKSRQHPDSDDDLPTINARRFRFTLASISNFLGLGDAAFQQQAKHARITMSHSYQANSGTREWSDILNTIIDGDATERAAKAFDLHMGVWARQTSLTGHAGREFTRTV